MKRTVCGLLAVWLCFISLPVLEVSALETSAKAAVLISGGTGEIIYQYNAEEKLPMASTTKIMTALLLCENGDFDRQITVTEEMVRVEGTSMGLLPGDKVTLHDLLYGMLLASGNDAANVTAYVLGGTVDGFAKKMNDKAAQLGLKNTHFATPSGLDAEDHYTTALDLALLSKYAMQNEHFRAAASAESAVLEYGNPPYRRTLTNHNKLLKTFDGAVGVKTGFTKKSGRCLVSAAERDGKLVIAVTLNDPSDWADHEAMLSYGLDKIKTAEIAPEEREYSIEVISSDNQMLTFSVDPYTVNSLSVDNLTCKVHLPEFVYAPVKKGEVIGSVVYYKDGERIHEQELTANRDVPEISQKSGPAAGIAENFIHIFKYIWES